MTEHTQESTGPSPEEIEAGARQMVEAQLAQRADPEAYAKAQAIAGVEAEFSFVQSATEDKALLASAAALRDQKLAEIETAYAPIVREEPAVLTADSLGLSAKTGTAIWSASQYVEPERDGRPWCDWDQAEDMLVQAAKAATRGMTGVKAKGYRLTRDEAKSTLTLDLV